MKPQMLDAYTDYPIEGLGDIEKDMMNNQIIFTDSELKLIYDLVCSNSEWKEDEECKDHDSIINKIHKLCKEIK